MLEARVRRSVEDERCHLCAGARLSRCRAPESRLFLGYKLQRPSLFPSLFLPTSVHWHFRVRLASSPSH